MKYVNKDTMFHRLDPRTKILVSLAGAVLIVIMENPLSLILLVLSLLAGFLSLRPSSTSIKIIFAIMGIAFLSTVLSQSIFYTFEPRTALITILARESGILGQITGGIYLYREGISYGAVQACRLFSALLLSTILVTSTYPSDLILGLKRLGVPEKIGFIVMVSFRFLPSLVEEAKRILIAQQLRGLKLRGARGAFQAFRFLISPLIIDSLRTARRIALAAEVRAFTGKRTELKTLKFARLDGFTLSLVFTILILAIGQRLIL